MQKQVNFFCTPEVLDVVIPDIAEGDEHFGIFIVMEHFGTSLKNLLDMKETSQLNANHM